MQSEVVSVVGNPSFKGSMSLQAAQGQHVCLSPVSC